MYLEFSARGSGKTYRLVEAIYKNIEKGNTSVYFSARSKEVQKKYFNHNYYKDKVLFPRNRDNFFDMIIGSGYKHISLFYDDFEYMDDILYDPNGYYVTTLLDTYNPVHRELLRLNNNKVIKYYGVFP